MVDRDIITRLADEVRARLTLTTSVASAVPFERLIDGLDIPTLWEPLKARMRTHSALQANVWGLTTFNLKACSATIWLNRTAWGEVADGTARTRFTVAHELGHVALHAEEIDELYVRPDDDHHDRLEREANRFAAHLLIPDAAIKRFADERADVIAKRFGVSLATASRRLNEWRGSS